MITNICKYHNKSRFAQSCCEQHVLERALLLWKDQMEPSGPSRGF